MRLLVGETVYVLQKEQVGIDEFNAPVYSETQEQVDDVLVHPGGSSTGGATTDIIESERPDGALISYTLHFPKTYEGELAHKNIIVRGITCSVIGYPSRYTPENTPGKWNMQVNVRSVDG